MAASPAGKGLPGFRAREALPTALELGELFVEKPRIFEIFVGFPKIPEIFVGFPKIAPVFCPKTANFPEFPLSGGPTPSGIRVFRRKTAKWRHPPPERGSRDSGRGRRSQRPLDWASFSSKNRVGLKFSSELRMGPNFSYLFVGTPRMGFHFRISRWGL